MSQPAVPNPSICPNSRPLFPLSTSPLVKSPPSNTAPAIVKVSSTAARSVGGIGGTTGGSLYRPYQHQQPTSSSPIGTFIGEAGGAGVARHVPYISGSGNKQVINNSQASIPTAYRQPIVIGRRGSSQITPVSRPTQTQHMAATYYPPQVVGGSGVQTGSTYTPLGVKNLPPGGEGGMQSFSRQVAPRGEGVQTAATGGGGYVSGTPTYLPPVIVTSGAGYLPPQQGQRIIGQQMQDQQQYQQKYDSGKQQSYYRPPWERDGTVVRPRGFMKNMDKQGHWAIKKERQGCCGKCNKCCLGCCDPGRACGCLNWCGCCDQEIKVLRRTSSETAEMKRMEAEAAAALPSRKTKCC